MCISQCILRYSLLIVHHTLCGKAGVGTEPAEVSSYFDRRLTVRSTTHCEPRNTMAVVHTILHIAECVFCAHDIRS